MDKIIFGDWLIKLNFDVKSQYDVKLHVGGKPFWSILYDDISQVFTVIVSFSHHLSFFLSFG